MWSLLAQPRKVFQRKEKEEKRIGGEVHDHVGRHFTTKYHGSERKKAQRLLLFALITLHNWIGRDLSIPILKKYFLTLLRKT